MKYFDWNIETNNEIKENRDISFEEIVFHIMGEGLIDIIEHPNKDKYSDQRIFIVNVQNYVYIVPFVESDEIIFLKTIIPSRKMTKQYLGGDDNEN